MQKFLDALSPGWIGTLIGIIGLVIAIATYLLTRKRSILSYSTKEISLIGTSDAKFSSDLTIQYKGINIPRLTKLIIVFWNDGENTITKNEIAAKEPLRIVTNDENSILSISILKSSRDITGIEYYFITPQRACLSFDFLDHNDGCTLEILHTGNIRSINILGTIIGMPSGLINHGPIISRPRFQIFKSLFSIDSKLNISLQFENISTFFMGTLLILLTYLAKYIFPNSPNIDIYNYLSWLGYISIGYGILLEYISRRKYPSSIHVPALD